MTPSTDVDERGRMAAEALRSAVQDLRIPETQRETAPRKRRVSLALAAILLAGVVAAALVVRDDDPTKVTTGIPGALPLLVPTFVPEGSVLHRAEPGTQDFLVTTTIFSSTPKQVSGRGELMISVRTSEALFGAGTIDNANTDVRGRSARIDESPVDNRETLRVLSWFETTNTMVVVQSVTMDETMLLAAAEELQIADGAVANKFVAGLSLLSQRSSADQRETAVLVLRGPQPDRFMFITTASVDTGDTADWLPGKHISVLGHNAWLSHQPTGLDDSPNLAVTIVWAPAAGTTTSIFASNFSDDEALRVARSLREVSQSEWDALPTQ